MASCCTYNRAAAVHMLHAAMPDKNSGNPNFQSLMSRELAIVVLYINYYW
jgi:hypothetical protein